MERIDDEPFWRAQERRRERELGQPCCTQSGISWQLMDMPGRFAVVVHGEYDCVNCFRHNAGRSSVQYFSTRLSEGQLTSGETAEPLRRCLELIVEHERPDAVVVLGTCPVEVIGDQFDRVVEGVSRETGVPMVALHTSGLKLSTQQDMLDWCFDTLVGLGDNTGKPVSRSSVALVGMPVSRLGAAEIATLMTSTSLEMLASFPNGATLSDWARLPQCGSIVVSDTACFRGCWGGSTARDARSLSRHCRLGWRRRRGCTATCWRWTTTGAGIRSRNCECEQQTGSRRFVRDGRGRRWG